MEFLAFAWINEPQIWLSLITLTALEIVLGIDNLVFIAILTGRLPMHQRALGRKVGLALALVTRLMLLATPRIGNLQVQYHQTYRNPIGSSRETNSFVPHVHCHFFYMV